MQWGPGCNYLIMFGSDHRPEFSVVRWKLFLSIPISHRLFSTRWSCWSHCTMPSFSCAACNSNLSLSLSLSLSLCSTRRSLPLVASQDQIQVQTIAVRIGFWTDILLLLPSSLYLSLPLISPLRTFCLCGACAINYCRSLILLFPFIHFHHHFHLVSSWTGPRPDAKHHTSSLLALLPHFPDLESFPRVFSSLWHSLIVSRFVPGVN